MKLKTAGRVEVSKTVKKQGRDARTLSDEASTIVVGPFTTEAVHADVGGDVRVTLSQNYHSVSLGISVRIPVNPNAEAVKKGLDYCFETAHDYLNEELKGAREALDKLAG